MKKTFLFMTVSLTSILASAAPCAMQAGQSLKGAVKLYPGAPAVKVSIVGKPVISIGLNSEGKKTATYLVAYQTPNGRGFARLVFDQFCNNTSTGTYNSLEDMRADDADAASLGQIFGQQ